jgi:hypothetical protein
MAEWLKAAVLKTVCAGRCTGVRIPLPPPQLKDPNEILKGGISNRGHLGRLTGVAYFQVFSFPTEIWNRMGRQGCDYQERARNREYRCIPCSESPDMRTKGFPDGVLK